MAVVQNYEIIILIVVWVEPDSENDFGDLKCMWLCLNQTLHYCLVCVFGLGLAGICFHLNLFNVLLWCHICPAVWLPSYASLLDVAFRRRLGQQLNTPNKDSQ